MSKQIDSKVSAISSTVPSGLPILVTMARTGQNPRNISGTLYDPQTETASCNPSDINEVWATGSLNTYSGGDPTNDESMDR